MENETTITDITKQMYFSAYRKDNYVSDIDEHLINSYLECCYKLCNVIIF